MPDRARLGPIFLEAFLVVLGVSLALAGEEWRATARAREHARTARASIIEELHANVAELEHSRAYHAALLDTLGPLARQPDAEVSPALFREGFVHPARLLSTAWDAALATDALAEMPYEDVLDFSRLYAQQARYETTTTETAGVLYRDLMDHGAFGVAARFRNLMALIGAMKYTEDQLAETYRGVLGTAAPAAEVAPPGAPLTAPASP
jgi:hypothetical protein